MQTDDSSFSNYSHCKQSIIKKIIFNMMHKHHLLQNNYLIKTKGAMDNINAKVTVQYIRNQQLFERSNNTNSEHKLVDAAAQDELEIENVEYLEENPNVEEYIEEPGDKDELEDNFYPNAIHCLLDLYKIKYENLSTENGADKADQLWRDIAKDMQESFFEFNERQIKHKYALLREQYFALQTKEDIENFDYFEQLHDIYKDLSKENIAKGFSGVKVSCVYYKDDLIMQPAHTGMNEERVHDFKSEEIVHKEHEFIDMVEKELQAMEDGVHEENTKEPAEVKMVEKDSNQCMVSHILKNKETSTEEKQNSIKRARLDPESCEESSQGKAKLNEYFEFNEITHEPSFSSNKKSNEFSLYLYNQEQERRHREKMSMLEKSLLIQERVIEQQQQLLQELIKRLPS